MLARPDELLFTKPTQADATRAALATDPDVIVHVRGLPDPGRQLRLNERLCSAADCGENVIFHARGSADADGHGHFGCRGCGYRSGAEPC